ncbi:MAG: glycosyltransferase family protein [Candidatus Binatia bacterium]
MRVLCHAQHLSGVGHFVRMHAIACGLAAGGHEVHLVDGGRPVPRSEGAHSPAPVRLPPLVRAGERLVAGDGALPVDAVVAERARALVRAVERIRPDVLLVDHFPFGKWELTPEITAAAETARRRGARVVCSLRDIVRQTRFEDGPHDAYEARVLGLLRAHFDGVLVHADPSFVRLEEHFRRAADLPVPMRYTGFVGEAARAPACAPALDPYVVLSCGGTRSTAFLLAAIDGFRRASAAGALGTMCLLVFPDPFAGAAETEALRAAARDERVRLCGFTPEFAHWLEGSALSISRGGYNTSVQLLRSRVAAVVVPDPRMSDQGPRARRLAELGLATVVEGDPPPADAVAAAIAQALAEPPRRHGLDLGGVATTRALLEGLAAGSEAGWSSTGTSASRSTPV